MGMIDVCETKTATEKKYAAFERFDFESASFQQLKFYAALTGAELDVDFCRSIVFGSILSKTAFDFTMDALDDRPFPIFAADKNVLEVLFFSNFLIWGSRIPGSLPFEKESSAALRIWKHVVEKKISDVRFFVSMPVEAAKYAILTKIAGRKPQVISDFYFFHAGVLHEKDRKFVNWLEKKFVPFMEKKEKKLVDEMKTKLSSQKRFNMFLS